MRLHNQPVRPTLLTFLLASLLGGCAVEDSHISHSAQTRLLGLSEVDLEACLGVPDQHATFDTTDILTYFATSSSSTSYSLPIVGGIGLSNGGYCHATFRLDRGRVTQLLYSGEKNATLAPDSYCAPIFRTCMTWLSQHKDLRSSAAADQGTQKNSAAGSGAIPPGATSAAPQPGASTAALPANVPTPTPR